MRGRCAVSGEHYIHDVRNVSSAPTDQRARVLTALSTMNRYDLTSDGGLITLKTERRRSGEPS